MKTLSLNSVKFSRLTIPAVAAALALSQVSCVNSPMTQTQKAAVTGAVAGGIIGGVAEDSVGGAAAGAALGALAGAATSEIVKAQRARQRQPYPYQEPRGYYEESPPVERVQPRDTTPYRQTRPQPRTEPQYPVATRTANPNQVISPYPPNNTIDVAGFKSGEIAIDPTTNKIFVVP